MTAEEVPPQEQRPWEERYISITADFGVECANLRDSNPYDQPALQEIMVFLATELWDHGFSQSEIKDSFETAVTLLTPYCAGEEKRGDREKALNSKKGTS